MNRAKPIVLTLLAAGVLGLGGLFPGERAAQARPAASAPASATTTAPAATSATAPAAKTTPPVTLHVDTSALTPAPDFKLPDLKGTTHSLADYRGSVVALTFWSTSCSPCRVEVPALIELQKTYGEKGLRVVGVAVKESDKEDLALFARVKSINYDVLLGSTEAEKAFGGIKDTPTTFIITQDGKVFERYVGLQARETFEADSKKLLGIAS
jgi:cytochrome c biogenesis protein CcmG/thiol:disulfide interchange protein DsbE